MFLFNARISPLDFKTQLCGFEQGLAAQHGFLTADWRVRPGVSTHFLKERGCFEDFMLLF